MTDPTAPHQIAELKVSAHTMPLDPGIYCIFSASGSPTPDVVTGLPVVRITAPPGHAASQVSIVGLDSEGWITPDSATLVRVAKGPAEVLVTVYQASNSAVEAPALQVVCISAGLASTPAAMKSAKAPAPQPNLTADDGPVPVQILAHIYSRGDVGTQIGDWMGQPGSTHWIEGFAIAPIGLVPPSDIEYQAVLGRGWLSPWSEGGQFCGSRAMSLPILGLRIRLKGASAATKRIQLEATFVDGSTVGPVGSGEPCEADSLAALEAFRLVIEDASAAPRKPAAKATAPKPTPARPTPAKSTSAKGAPTKVAPVKSTPAKGAPTKPAPVKVTPVKVAPVKATPAKPAAANAAPANAKPTKATPAKTAPPKADTAKATTVPAPAAAPAITAAPKARASRTPAPTRRR